VEHYYGPPQCPVVLAHGGLYRAKQTPLLEDVDMDSDFLWTRSVPRLTRGQPLGALPCGRPFRAWQGYVERVM
jgi:hypothetical protein